MLFDKFKVLDYKNVSFDVVIIVYFIGTSSCVELHIIHNQKKKIKIYTYINMYLKNSELKTLVLKSHTHIQTYDRGVKLKRNNNIDRSPGCYQC